MSGHCTRYKDGGPRREVEAADERKRFGRSQVAQFTLEGAQSEFISKLHDVRVQP
jgi:hypothetical protein